MKQKYRIVELLRGDGSKSYLLEQNHGIWLLFDWWYAGSGDTLEEARAIQKKLEDRTVLSKTVIK